MHCELDSAHKVYIRNLLPTGGTPIEEYGKQFVVLNQHSNGWAELAVKMTKRIFAHNADRCGVCVINTQFLIS